MRAVPISGRLAVLTDASGVLSDARALEQFPLNPDWRTSIRVIRDLRSIARASSASTAQRSEAATIADRMAQHVLETFREQFGFTSGGR
jgi:hypothetical protein